MRTLCGLNWENKTYKLKRSIAIEAIANLCGKKIGTSKGFEPMAAALALQCGTNCAMKNHTLGAGQLVEFILTREWNET